ncbi:MAG: FAD-binding protein [Leptolyngbyaceae cyanobacterium RM2_2_4]|nr:FAD-binding protein [Leptolyngbyaceae cyanobacterium SM1_4_3]NJN90773.1 FAD-binding protein [Leptolyngbyaceae cyanobacterium SL_5_14]NJO48813.1 FAD-binding protein [Leptolyngbyaceae cyanobacterium RM2_2_4]
MPNNLASKNSILSDLEHLVEGEVSTTEEDLAAVSKDFGGMIQKRPQVVVRPQSSLDVANAVKYAAAQGLIISSKAAGHSCSGQSLNQDGILLDMRTLNQIHEFCLDDLWFKVDSGTTWRKIVDASLPQGVVPPVLTNNFDVTIGGTHSAGGLGQNSFLYGSQADNCLGLEVVTATGELVWCTPEENSELFNHVLCGYGQFGIMTKIQHRLKRYRPFTRTYFLRYDDLDALLQDERLLVSEKRADGLLTLFSPCVLGASRAGGNGFKPLIQWFYRMQLTVETDSPDDVNEEKLLSDLKFARHVHTEDLNFDKFVQPIAEVPHPVGEANPWLDVFLPASVAQEFIEIALERIPTFVDFRSTPVGGFCLASNSIKMPMFPMPSEEFVIGFGMYPTVPKPRLQPVAEQLNRLTELAFEMGAKRYMGSWLELDLPGWRHQFGEYWGQVNEMKQKYDPQGILSPGFFQYEEAALSRQQAQPLGEAVAEPQTTVA